MSDEVQDNQDDLQAIERLAKASERIRAEVDRGGRGGTRLAQAEHEAGAMD